MKIDPARTLALVAGANVQLQMSQEELAQSLGASRRTMTRWIAGHSRPSVKQLGELARLAHARGKPELAAEIAAAHGETLETLAIVPRRAPVEAPQRPSPLVVDAVVCAAADAAGFTPNAVRGILFAAFERAAALGLTIEEVAAALRPRATAPEGAAQKSAPAT